MSDQSARVHTQPEFKVVYLTVKHGDTETRVIMSPDEMDRLCTYGKLLAEEVRAGATAGKPIPDASFTVAHAQP